VQTFLASQLQWTVTSARSPIIQPGKLTALQIAIVIQKVRIASFVDDLSNFDDLKNSSALSRTSGR
jgi:hypothetical protein